MLKSKDKTFTSVIRSETIVSDNIEYSYNLLMKESSKVASYKIPLYSIEVKMKDKNGKITEYRISDVFADFGKAVVFYQKIVDNLATPMNLPYILEDEISYL